MHPWNFVPLSKVLSVELSMTLDPEKIEQWARESKCEAPTTAMTHAEIAHAIQKICEAFGASVPTQFKVAGLFVEALADEPADSGMCPNCVTPWKCNGPHELTPTAEVSRLPG